MNPVSAPANAPVINPVPGSIGAPAAPQVNLLPPEIAARRSQGRVRALIVVIFGLFLVAVAAVYFLVLGMRTAAENELQAEQDRRLELQTELASYGYINELSDKFENSIKAREWAGSTDIDWATHLTALLNVAPEGIAFSDMTMAQGTPAGAVAGDGTAFQNADMGSISFTGRADTADLTADLIEAFDSLPGFSDTWVEAKQMQANEETDTVYWEYSGATRITYTALSGRTETEQTKVPQSLLDELEAADNATDTATTEEEAN
ncbi:PilN domain-containing protein [Demequina maris]|uniref:PilN domain-containing protein n=1 Tax=Demequina maris TaxID=1638982 RepID=UPI000782E745|nr:hypothetical protein [Demequina maris]